MDLKKECSSIEIINGEILKDENIEFKDYDWECICPNMGG